MLVRHIRPTLVAATLVLALVACDAEQQTSEAPAGGPASPSAQQAGPPAGSGGQSLWTLIGSGGRTVRQLPDDDPDVAAIRRTVVLQSGASANRSHRDAAASVDKEFAFLSDEFARSLKKKGFDTALADLYEANGLNTRQTQVAWFRSTVHEDRETAEAVMDSVIEFTEGDQDYLRQRGLALRKPYTEHRKVSLVKTGGQWKISAIKKAPLDKARERPDKAAGPKR